MLFNSFEFLLFLPVVFLLYWFIFCSRKQQNMLLLIASYVFYGWWDWRFLFLILFTSACSYVSGIMMQQMIAFKHNICILNIIINVAILALFKYFNFFIDNFELLFNTLGYHLDWPTLKIILPVGISFYTFQALSYTIDVYRDKIEPTKDIIAFFAYISFFPQLVAGPIERATSLLPQFHKQRVFNYPQAVDGMRQMLWGFLKKLVIADNCAVVVNNYWFHYSELPGFALVVLCILFTIQIYCDFSGYSDIAIGCSRLFGFNLMRNFNNPYFAKSIQEHWQRWHISLMSWFRDYVYIPMGGNRCSLWKRGRNIILVFLISGFWHGANWTYIVWGLYHALLILICKFGNFNYLFLKLPINATNIILLRIKNISQMALTFSLVAFGFIIFRSESVEQAFEFMSSLFTFSSGFFDTSMLQGRIYLCFGWIILFVEWIQRDKQHALQFSQSGLFKYRLNRWLTYYFLLFVIVKYAGASQSFIYFQF